MSKHSPTPWTTDSRDTHRGGDDAQLQHVRDANGIILCEVLDDVRHPGRREADALLIAAAPELLQALESLCERFDAVRAARDYRHDLWSAALAAVARARGQCA